MRPERPAARAARPSSRVFFSDRDLGKQFPARLREAGLEVERHADHFAPDTPDEVWLTEEGRRGWIVLTHDERIRYKANELAARPGAPGRVVLWVAVRT